MPDFGDICSTKHGGSPTSTAAHRRLGPNRRMSMRERIAHMIMACGASGATCEEVELRFNMKHQTASARISELKRDLVIRDSGRKRATVGGDLQVVVVAASAERTLF